MSSCIPPNSVDPDVAGIGVLITFAASSLITIVAIVVAYFRQALRPDRYNSLDKVIIGLETVSDGVRTQRIAALESFLKALSDQQLFTALALTLTIYLLQYHAPRFDTDVSAYPVCLAVNIALLSSSVHLSATTILRDHFDKNKRLRDVRVLIMLTTIICLLPQLALTQIMDPSVTLRCALHADELISDLNRSGDKYDRTVFLSTSAIILALVCGYGRRLLELYSPLFRQSPERWVAGVFHIAFRWPSADQREKLNREAASYNEEQSLKLPTYSGIILHGQVFRIVSSEFRQSFFTELIWLLFYTVFSLCQMVFFIIWSLEPGESPISLSWGFGQVLPLVLLGLPVVSALEFYQGK
ncbi:hypothetical protein CDV31_003246 [Fusarium ambrosium]|uniref:Uncharacterized protein n=1 Tax=Fusarium ambrosium TaxID=131363 RepID=A0A428UU87_9HYPO|nr:hypothetical protein CDV31_003246 [Fusarium ambrosium]